MGISIKVLYIRNDFQGRYDLHLRLIVLDRFAELWPILGILILTWPKESMCENVIILNAAILEFGIFVKKFLLIEHEGVDADAVA